MILNSISILNYRNIEAAELVFSDKFNCFIGNNGEGKTNLLDALYFLSFCHSMFTNVDSQRISSCLMASMIPVTKSLSV